MSAFDPQDCGCAAYTTQARKIHNRPALPVIEYRAGTYSSFMQAMRASAAEKDELKLWTARSPHDFGMQFLDMWAYLGDILTFYQERIANEAYLRTATQRESIMRLAAALDYRLGPGAAASVHLAFTLDKDRTLMIPVGLKTQSVPGQNEKPQKFETIEAIQADAKWNRIRVFPRPQAVLPFAANSTGGTLVNEAALSKPLATGNSLAVFDGRNVEIKEITAIHKTDTGTQITWNAPIKTTLTDPEARLYGRQFRLFGNQAPSQFMIPVTDANAPGGIRWKIETPSFLINPQTDTFALEILVHDLKSGSEMLVVHTDSNPSQRFVRKGTVISAIPTPVNRGTIQATVTQVHLQFAGTIPDIPLIDLRNVTIYELTDAPIQLATSEYPQVISDNNVYIPISILTEYPVKRSIILDDSHGEPHIATVDMAVKEGDHLLIRFMPALARPFAMDTAVMFGNVAKATHGETVKNEILGNGDASVRLQKFQLKKDPITFIPQPGATNGVANTLEVRVDGVLWTEIANLLGAAADAQVYTALVGDDSKMTVQFGGEPGSRLPSGRNNVVAQYRQGLGSNGNVSPGSIKTLLDRPIGLKSAENLVAASGGAAAEPLEMARSNAPNTVRTFGRIVSLLDFEDAARELAIVAKAKSALTWTGHDQEVSIAVAGEGGMILSSSVMRDVLADLNSRRDLNRRLSIRTHFNVPLSVSGRIQVNTTYLLDSVQAAANSALLNLFEFDRRGLGEPAFISDVFRVLQNVAGVIAVDLDTFQYHSARTKEYDLHLMRVGMAGDLLNTGRSLVVAALVDHAIHIRIFDVNGKIIVDKPESELTKGKTLTAIKMQLSLIFNKSDVSTEQKQKLIQRAILVSGLANPRVDVLTVQWFEILTLDAFDINLHMQHEML